MRSGAGLGLRLAAGEKHREHGSRNQQAYRQRIEQQRAQVVPGRRAAQFSEEASKVLAPQLTAKQRMPGVEVASGVPTRGDRYRQYQRPQWHAPQHLAQPSLGNY